MESLTGDHEWAESPVLSDVRHGLYLFDVDVEPETVGQIASSADDMVDADLQTEVGNLFVCDASVPPKAPGLPPILTIVALAKRLATSLAA